MSEPSRYPIPRIKDLAVGERPQERQERCGPETLTDTEQLAMILRSGSAGRNVKCVAEDLLAAAGGNLAGLLTWSAADFRRVKGIGRVKAQQLVSVLEISRRMLAQREILPPQLEYPQQVFEHFRAEVLSLTVEKFWVLSLNRRSRLLRRDEITSGTATSSLVHPREVFREAIKAGACAIIAVHNHPSGDPAPSSADLQITRQLATAARTVEIALIDHVILGQPTRDPAGRGYYSFREAGLL
ncbi:MAG TPA: DNA repair protein RadC [Opitutaceae bacterium]|nr:DNA repair protein RadC [Opitutaceae bacterium]